MFDRSTDLIIDSELVEALGQAVETRLHTVTPDQDDMRLDRTLALAVPEFSRSYLQQLIEQSAVTLNGMPAHKSAKHLRAGDVLTVELKPTEQSQAYVPEDVPVEVVFEDAHLLVVNKPAGLVVHPAPGNWRGTLLNGILKLYPESRHLPRAGIVHRLDKDTSGLMVIAKTRLCMDALTLLISNRDVSREYFAIAHGAWRSFAGRDTDDQSDHVDHGEPDRIVTQSIGRDSRNRLKMAAYDPLSGHAKPARTDIYVLHQLDDFTAVECKLHTGRTHQIRVHMAYIGHPLVADGTYGGTPALGLTRQALHAKRLAFVHPMLGEHMEFLSPLPPDLKAALKAFE
jgi:23S rRNA pseudouridine1911/1915/1917 synthase